MNQDRQKISGEVKIPENIFQEVGDKIANVNAFNKVIEKNLSENISIVSDIIFLGGISLEASDIHIEPEEKKAKIRVRIDGVLQDIINLDIQIYQSLVSRIKLLSGLKLNVADRSQDGRFSILLPENHSVEIRTSALPAEYGESIVLRILNPKNLISLEELGLRKDLFDLFVKEIKKPSGMIVVTGPTGSGKTTTLYSFLKSIHNPQIKIITIEDPIEYHLEGISQTEVHPEKGYDFANGLKAIVRQDPDVILVGEIRDLETVQIGLQAALTGHLVFTTLHANNASGTIARFQALGESPTNIAPGINICIAQRLVRKVCQKCSQKEKASSSDLEKIKKALKGIPKEIIKLPASPEIRKAKGCEVCNNTGYKGRIGIFEALVVDAEIEKFILTNPSISGLLEKAVKKGMITIYQDGIIKALDGITTIEEVERIAEE